MKTLFSNKLFFLIFFLLISTISSENKKENSLSKKSNEEADNNKIEKSSVNKIENKNNKKEGRIKDEKNTKEIPEKSDKKERKKEDENSYEDKPKHLNETQNKNKKNNENNSKKKIKNSNEEQDKDKNKDENNKNNKNEEDENNNKTINNHKKKKDNVEEEDENKEKRKSKKDSEEDKMDEDENKGHKKLKKNKEENKNDNKEEDSEKGEKKEEGKNEEKGEKKNKKEMNKKCEAIFLGFDRYNEDKDEDKISFNIYFIPVNFYIKANKLKVPLKIKLKESLRSLNDEEQIIECTKKNKKGEKQIRFKCLFEKKNRKIEKIEVDVNKFNFIGQEVKIKSCSPLAMKNMKNLQKVGKEKQFKNKIYVLENAELKQNEKNFNIMGTIKDKDFDKEEVTLTFLDSKKKENKVDCKIKKNKGKYIFECEPKNDINGNLDGAYGDLEDKNIVINFKNNEDSEIYFIVEKADNNKNKNLNKKKESNKKIKRHEKKKEDNDDDLQFVYEKNVKIDILIYICIGFIILLLITLVYNCIAQANYKESSKPYFDNNSMDTVKLSTQSNE